MPNVESALAPLHIPRLADLATSTRPAWLWSADGSRILWANAVGAAVFGAARASECARRRFGANDASTGLITRLAASLPAGGQERLERLRGFGAGLGGALLCACSRLVLADGTAAILVAATEPTGPTLPLGERVHRLFADDQESGEALAVFAPDGTLLHATASAMQRLGATPTLAALGIEALAANAFAAGRAQGAARLGTMAAEVTAQRLGKDDSRVLVVTLPPGDEHAATPTEPATPAAAGTQPKAAPAPPAAHDTPALERRHPLRFVWQMDAAGHFIVGSDEFIELVGPRTTAACGRLWSEIATELSLDPDNLVARAIATHETWSGITTYWPADDSTERLPIELSGLPIFDRDHAFAGYRGFGVCRDLIRINHLAQARRGGRAVGLPPVPPATPADAAGVAAAAAGSASARAAEDAKSSASPAAALGGAAAAVAAAEALPHQERHAANVAPASANVVPFRQAAAAEAKTPTLSPGERKAFRELAQELTARLHAPQPAQLAETVAEESPVAEQEDAAAVDAPSANEDAATEAAKSDTALPAAVAPEIAPEPAPVTEATSSTASSAQTQRPPAIEHALLDRVPAGVLVHRNDSLLYANRRLLEWSGYANLDALAAAGGLHSLFGEPSASGVTEGDSTRRLSLRTQSGETLPVEGRLFAIPWNEASALALVLTSAQAGEAERASQLALAAAEKEISELKASQERTARREAQKAAAAKADFLAKVSHEIRTPLNAMIGFAEVIMAERFGPIGNERYREYLKDMHGAGTHLVSLLNDLLDLSRVETGQLDLNFTDVELNDLIQQCVAIMQPQANRARTIIRCSLTQGLPQVVADERSLRQIMLNLLSNAIKFTGPGGQVIVSTALLDGGGVVLRVRDTGVGMSEKDVEAALEPFQQTATSGSWGSGGTGLGLPLTRALAEANRASFSIKSAPNAGTLVEIAFPAHRIRVR